MEKAVERAVRAENFPSLCPSALDWLLHFSHEQGNSQGQIQSL